MGHLRQSSAPPKERRRMGRNVTGLSLRLLLLLIAWVVLRAAPSPTPELPAVPALTLAMAVPATPPCADGMALVDGDYCDTVEQVCLNERPKPRFGCVE